MKVVSTEALTKLIQLVKSAFIKTDDVVEVTEIETETPSEVELAAVATSGSYNDLSNKPTIPTVNNATLTIQKNGSNVATFTANASSNVTANISVPNVTSTYTATGTDAVNGVAVANAIAPKQDTLVSGTNIKTINGNSLLGSGNITIETSSTPNVDGETISYNSSDALQAIAVKNVRDGSTLPIWHGTEYQWNHGAPTTWYYWQTSVTAMWTSGGDLPSYASSYTDRSSIAAYNDNIIVSLNKTYFSSNKGNTWTEVPLREPALCYGNNKIFAVKGTKSYYFDVENLIWIEIGTISSTSYVFRSLTYSDGMLIASCTGTHDIFYSLDEGTTWQTVTLTDLYPAKVFYKNGRFVGIATTNSSLPFVSAANRLIYSEDGINWNTKTQNTDDIEYGNDKFVIMNVAGKRSYYSTNGETWTEGGSFPVGWNSRGKLSFGGGTFLATFSSKDSCYSTDGINWTSSTLPVSGSWLSCYCNNYFFASAKTVANTAVFSIQYDKCYTDTTNPTTTSVVYSAPETQSALTISSVTSGAITLSNNNTYYYNQSGNQYTYDTIGNSHPEYLCFIDGVGVKMGNTMIAQMNPTITTSIISSSTDSEVPSAKAVYTEMNKVNLTVNLTGYVSYFKNFIIDDVTYSYSDFTNNSLIIRVPRNIDLPWTASSQGTAYVPSPSSGTINTNTDYTLTINLVFNM